MNKEFYPELTEEGHKEAQKLMDDFKQEMGELAKDILANLYCDVAVHIESDSWTNYKNSILSALCNYGSDDTYSYDYEQLRQAIYRNHKEEIIKDLNQDLVKENEKLKKQMDNIRFF